MVPFFWKKPELIQALGEDFDMSGHTLMTMLRVRFVTSFILFYFSALFYKNNPDSARTKSSKGPATGGKATSVSANTPPFRHLVCRPIGGGGGGRGIIRHRTLLLIAPFILQFMLECGTESGDEVTLVQRPIDRGHKICFTMAVSTIYLFPRGW